MLKKQSQVFLSILFIIDLFIVGISWNLAFYLRFYLVNYPIASYIPNYYTYFKSGMVVTVLAAICFVYGKMYNPKRIARHGGEARAIFQSSFLLYILLLGLTFYYRKFSFSRAHSLYFILLSLGGIVLFRFSVRFVLSYLRKHGKNLRKILIIGNGLTAKNFIKKILDNESFGFSIAGHVANPQYKSKLGESALGTYQDIPDILIRHRIDQVYIALDSDQQSDLKIINSCLAEQMVDLNIVPDIYHTLNINPEILDLDGIPIIALRQSLIGGWNQVLKRSFDLVGAAVAIIFLFPLWIIIPILIKLTSPGPVLYIQERMGLDGKSFNMLKFRTMRIDAEKKSGAVWATKNDSRKTRLGSFLRKTSLDELPQFFNVMAGTMSIVGPRPERPVFIKDFKKQIPNYMLRHKMKAGITGWAQVNGWRGNTSLEKRIEYDIYYLANWSILFDLKILLLTLFTGFVNPNAY